MAPRCFALVDKYRHTPYNQNQKQQARAPLLERPRGASSIIIRSLDVLHHVLHPTLEQVAQAVDGVGGHALAVSDSIVGGTGKSHLFKAV